MRDLKTHDFKNTLQNSANYNPGTHTSRPMIERQYLVTLLLKEPLKETSGSPLETCKPWLVCWKKSIFHHFSNFFHFKKTYEDGHWSRWNLVTIKKVELFSFVQKIMTVGRYYHVFFKLLPVKTLFVYFSMITHVYTCEWFHLCRMDDDKANAKNRMFLGVIVLENLSSGNFLWDTP